MKQTFSLVKEIWVDFQTLIKNQFEFSLNSDLVLIQISFTDDLIEFEFTFNWMIDHLNHNWKNLEIK